MTTFGCKNNVLSGYKYSNKEDPFNSTCSPEFLELALVCMNDEFITEINMPYTRVCALFKYAHVTCNTKGIFYDVQYTKTSVKMSLTCKYCLMPIVYFSNE